MTRIAAIASLVCCALYFHAAVALAQPAAAEKENPVHEQLRQLRAQLIDAVGTGDLDAMLAQLRPDVVVTWLNGEQSRGHQQVREYYNRMMKGDQRRVKSLRLSNVEVKELTQLYGDDTGVAYGTAKSHFVLTDGRAFTIDSPWTAVVVNDGGKWSVAALHSSTNMFDNPILGETTAWIYRAAAIAGGIGLVLGLLLMAMIKRRGRSAQGEQGA